MRRPRVSKKKAGATYTHSERLPRRAFPPQSFFSAPFFLKRSVDCQQGCPSQRAPSQQLAPTNFSHVATRRRQPRITRVHGGNEARVRGCLCASGLRAAPDSPPPRSLALRASSTSLMPDAEMTDAAAAAGAAAAADAAKAAAAASDPLVQARSSYNRSSSRGAPAARVVAHARRLRRAPPPRFAAASAPQHFRNIALLERGVATKESRFVTRAVRQARARARGRLTRHVGAASDPPPLRADRRRAQEFGCRRRGGARASASPLLALVVHRP